MKLKIYSDKRYLPDGVEHESILAPFWGLPQQAHLGGPNHPWSKRFQHYVKIAPDLFELTALSEADFALLPTPWHAIRGNTWRTLERNEVAQELALEFAEKANRAGKPLVVFFPGDCSDENIPIKNAIVLRESMYRSKRKPTDFAMASFNEDLLEQYLGNELPIRQKQPKPTVSFCGYTKRTPFWKGLLKSAAYHGVMLAMNGQTGVPAYVGHNLRCDALDLLEQSPLVDTNFIRKDDQVSLRLAPDAVDTRKKLRLEFLQNMVDSDYVLCCRGAGNYSYRFGEILCAGRIPVFIDTDCVLPYDFAVEWKKYFVWLDESELPYIGEKVAEFHNKLSPQDFVDLQYECRKLWEKWLSAQGFYANFYRHFNFSSSHRTASSAEKQPVANAG